MKALRFLNLLAAAFLLVFAALAYGGIWDARLDILTHFALPMTLAALASMTLGWLSAQRRPNAQLLIAATAFAAWFGLTGPDLGARIMPRSAPAGEAQVRLMSFNMFWQNVDPAKAQQAVQQSGADIVLLIETGGDGRFVPRELKATYPHRVKCACDMSILSRWPIIDDSVRHDRRPGAQQAPAIMWAVVRTPSGDVPVFGTHYDWPTTPAAQNQTQKQLIEAMARFDKGAMIVMGDFNSTPWSFFLRRQDKRFGLERRTRGLATWPAYLPEAPKVPMPFPMLPIDHVYAGSDWHTESVTRGPRAGSDHYPVFVTLSREP